MEDMRRCLRTKLFYLCGLIYILAKGKINEYIVFKSHSEKCLRIKFSEYIMIQNHFNSYLPN